MANLPKGNTILKSLLSSALGAQRVGALKFALFPHKGRAWGGAFNGQRWRCVMFAELLSKANVVAIYETGTFRGTTTEWMSAFQLPVHSCEANDEDFGFSQARLRSIENVELTNADSRVALRKFIQDDYVRYESGRVLFYLDAHWSADLPLAEEIAIIFSNCRNAVVLIDDFQVPGEPGYLYDDYGQGAALDETYISDVVSEYALSRYYPTTKPASETGARRGCVVLARREESGTVMESVSLIRLGDTG